MLKENKRTIIFTSLLVLLPIFVGVFCWNSLPERMVIHWGSDNRPDGWSGRGMAVFGLPLILLAVHWLCVIATALDSKKNKQNKKVMALMLWITPVISWFGGGLTYAQALGYSLPVTNLATGWVGVLFIVVGNYMPKCRPSRTFGIRIRWTLRDEENWNATHRFAGRLWVAGGVALLLALLLPPTLFLAVLLVALLVLVGLPVLYSYRYFRRHNDAER